MNDAADMIDIIVVHLKTSPEKFLLKKKHGDFVSVKGKL